MRADAPRLPRSTLVYLGWGERKGGLTAAAEREMCRDGAEMMR